MPHRCEMRLLQRAQVAPRLGRHARRDLLHQHPGAAEAIRGHDGSLSSPGHVWRRDLLSAQAWSVFVACDLDVASRGRARSVTAGAVEDSCAGGRPRVPAPLGLDPKEHQKGRGAAAKRMVCALRGPFPATRLFRGAGRDARFLLHHACLCRQQTPHGLAGCDPADGPLCARPLASDRLRHRRRIRLPARHVRAVSDEDPPAPRRRGPVGTNLLENARGGIGSDIGITTSSRGPGFASGSPPRYRPFTGSSCAFPKSARLCPRGSRRMCDASLMLTTTSPKIPISRPQAGPRWSTSSGSDRGKAATPTHGLIRAGTCASIPTRVRAG